MKNLIKQFSFLLVLVSTLVFLSDCGSDDEGSPAAQSDLIGVWTVNSAELDFEVDGQDLTEFLIASGVPESEIPDLIEIFESGFEESFTGTIEFKSDNTYSSTFEGDTEQGTWTLNGSTLTIDPSDGDAVGAQVITLTSSALAVSFTETETDDLDGDGTDETLSVSITLSLTK